MLSGSQLKALLLVSLPLVFYACIGQFFQLIDTFIAANMSANTISTVSFVNQLEKMLMAVATALSIGGGVLIGKSFGSGDMEQVKSRISTIFFLCLFNGIYCLPLATISAHLILTIIALTMIYIITFFILTGIFRLTIIGLFAKGNAPFAGEIDMIYKWERLDTILNALYVSVMGFLYAFGKTKVSMTLNIARLFAFRIPILLLLIIRREMKKS